MRKMSLRQISGFLVVLALLCGALASQAVASQGLVYTLSKDGELRGYLLGTVHSDDPRVLNFSEPFLAALKSCDRFAMELVPNQPTMARLMEYMHYQDGSTLEERIGAERFARVVEAASVYRMSAQQLSTMKVWAAMMTLSIPPPKNGLFMDLSLALQAAGEGLTVVGLETLEEQLSFLEDMPEEQQLVLLDQALEDLDELESYFEAMIADYVRADLDALKQKSDEQLADLPDSVESYFWDEGIEARNLRMRDRLVKELAEGSVFAAVGALHLPGDSGLVELMRKEGYAVEPAPFSPFAE